MTRVEGVRNFLLQSEKKIGYGRQRDTLKTYKEKDGKWTLDKDAPRPEDVVSKWFAELEGSE